MPEEDKKMVPLDTSGPDQEVDIEETKDESVVETEAPKQETETVEQETTEQDDNKLEEYSKGVQARIAKLTRKMREAERREQAATEYARAVEAGKGCPIYLKSTHENTLKLLPIETLKKFAIDLS